jgi:hypothetical protein
MLHITVDIVFVYKTKVTYTAQTFAEESQYDYLRQENHCDFAWQIISFGLPQVHPITTLAEALWLEGFGSESVVKTVIRILKSLNLENVPGPSDVADHCQEKFSSVGSGEVATDKLNTLSQQHTIHDLQISELIWNNYFLSVNNEVYQRTQYFSSYSFQTLVLLLFAASSKARPGISKHEIWQTKDIPRIVVTALDIIMAILSGKSQHRTIMAHNRVTYICLTLLMNEEPLYSTLFHSLLNTYYFRISSLLAHVKSIVLRLHRLAGVTIKVENSPGSAQTSKDTYLQMIKVTYNCILL